MKKNVFLIVFICFWLQAVYSQNKTILLVPNTNENYCSVLNNNVQLRLSLNEMNSVLQEDGFNIADFYRLSTNLCNSLQEKSNPDVLNTFIKTSRCDVYIMTEIITYNLPAVNYVELFLTVYNAKTHDILADFSQKSEKYANNNVGFLSKKALLLCMPKIKTAIANIPNPNEYYTEDDKIPPVIEIFEPQVSRGFVEIMENNSKTITVKGKATDASGVISVTVNSINANLNPNGDFFANIELSDNENKIIVKAIDKKFNSGTFEFTLQNADKTPPTIQIYEPVVSRGFQVVKAEQRTVSVRGKASDINGVNSVTVNNTVANVNSNGDFFVSIQLSEGINKIIVQATDRYSNIGTFEFNINKENNVENNLNVQNRRLALLIGNAAYTNGGSLRNPVNDVRAMELALQNLGFKVLKYENADLINMKKGIDLFGQKLKDYQIGLFFYAGHGIQVKGNNYLIPTDANIQNENDVEYSCLDVGRVLAKMEGANISTNVIILDACRDNPFERSWSRSSKGNGLAFMDAPAGSFIAYATSPGKTAADGTDNNGLYTSALLQYLSIPDLTIEQVFKKVRTTVIEKSNGLQVPWESTSLQGDFYFKK